MAVEKPKKRLKLKEREGFEHLVSLLGNTQIPKGVELRIELDPTMPTWGGPDVEERIGIASYHMEGRHLERNFFPFLWGALQPSTCSRKRFMKDGFYRPFELQELIDEVKKSSVMPNKSVIVDQSSLNEVKSLKQQQELRISVLGGA